MNLLFIRGVPGVGKHTVAKILAQSLGWKLFWLHDIDPIYKVVGGYRYPRLQDEITCAILKHLCRQHENIIFVRSARDGETVEQVRRIAKSFDYRFLLVTLHAKYETLLERVKEREGSSYRVSDKKGLDEYLSGRPEATILGEHVIATDYLKPQAVAEKIFVIAKGLAVSV